MLTLVQNPFVGVLYGNHAGNGESEIYRLAATTIGAAETDFLEVATARSYLLGAGCEIRGAVVRQVMRPPQQKPILPARLFSLQLVGGGDYWQPPNDDFSGPVLWGETANGRKSKRLLHFLADDELTAGHWIREGFTMPAGPATPPADPRNASKADLVLFYLQTLRDRTVHGRKVFQDTSGNTTWELTRWKDFYCRQTSVERIGRRWVPVSWEAGDYTFGPKFSPCGTVVGYERSSYDAPCRFYTNGAENQIRYYVAADAAALLPFPTIFHPSTQVQPYSRGAAPGEQTPFRPTWWATGESNGSAPGIAPTGTPAEFLGLTACMYNQSFPTPPSLLPECDVMNRILTVGDYPITISVGYVNELRLDGTKFVVSPLGTGKALVEMQPLETRGELCVVLAGACLWG